MKIQDTLSNLEQKLDITKKIVFFFGILSILFTALVISFYYSSNMSQKFTLIGFTMKVNDKILAEWTRLKPRIEKQYDIAKESGRKAHRRIELRMPYIRTAEKKVYYKTDEPRELRHPDEYGESAYNIIDGKDYAKYEAAQAKVSDMIEKFCKKHNFEFVWAASW